MGCPSEEALRDYVRSRSSPTARAALLAHASECGDCRQRIAEHSADDGVTAKSSASGSSSLASDRTALTDEPAGAKPLELGDWDQYRQLERIGAGGGGEVYKAYDPRLRRTVALKLLRAEAEPQARRFVAEAQAQARVEHECVCKVYEVGTVKGRSFIAMQYIAGQTLGAAAPSMTVVERITVMRQVAEAVHAAHRLGIVHRDLKPSNIMVERGDDGAWKPYVMDFGLARELATDGGTLSGSLIGTPSYMSPEQALGEVRRLDRRTDVYGLGATLYAVLVGRPPFEGASTVELLMHVVHDEPPPPRQLAPRLPRDLETVVLRCLEKDPQLRYDSARALAEDLEQVRLGEPIASRRVGPVRRWLRRARKQRAILAVLALGLCGVAALGGVALQARWSAAEGARFARQLGEQLRQIESVSRIAVLLPLHDTTAERAQIRGLMRAIEQQMRSARPTRRSRRCRRPGRRAIASRAWPMRSGRASACAIRRSSSCSGSSTPSCARGAAASSSVRCAIPPSPICAWARARRPTRPNMSRG
jgi:predicted Ser/Thr protein kinase